MYELLQNLRDRCLQRAANEAEGVGTDVPRPSAPAASSPMAAGRQQTYEWMVEQLDEALGQLETIKPEEGLAASPGPTLPAEHWFRQSMIEWLSVAEHQELTPMEVLSFCDGWRQRERWVEQEVSEALDSSNRLSRWVEGVDCRMCHLLGHQEHDEAVHKRWATWMTRSTDRSGFPVGHPEDRAETAPPSADRPIWGWNPNMTGTPRQFPTPGVLPPGATYALTDDAGQEVDRYVHLDQRWHRLLAGQPGNGPLRIETSTVPVPEPDGEFLIEGSTITAVASARPRTYLVVRNRDVLDLIADPTDPGWDK